MAIFTYMTLILSLLAIRLSYQISQKDLGIKPIEDLLRRFNLFPSGKFCLSKLSGENFHNNCSDTGNFNGFCTRYCRSTNGEVSLIRDLEIEQFNHNLSGTSSILQRVNGSCVKFCEGNVEKYLGPSPAKLSKSPKVFKAHGDNSQLSDTKVPCSENSKYCNKYTAFNKKESEVGKERDSYNKLYKPSSGKEIKVTLAKTHTTDEIEKGKVATAQMKLNKPYTILNLNIRIPYKNLGTPEIPFKPSNFDIQENTKRDIDPTLISNLDVRKFYKLFKMDSPSFPDFVQLIFKTFSYNSVNPNIIEFLNFTYEDLKLKLRRDVKRNKFPLVFVKTILPVIEEYLLPQLDNKFVRKFIRQVDNSFRFPRVFAYLKLVTKVPKNYLNKDFTLSNLIKFIDKLLKKIIIRKNLKNRALETYYKFDLRTLISIVKEDIDENNVPISSIKFFVDTLIKESHSWESKDFQKSLKESHSWESEDFQKSLKESKQRKGRTHRSLDESLEYEKFKYLVKFLKSLNNENSRHLWNVYGKLNLHKENEFRMMADNQADYF